VVAYLFATARRIPGYERHLQEAEKTLPGPSSHGAVETPKEQGADIARFMIMSVFAVLITHGLLRAGNLLLGGGELRGVKATMNAVLAWGAVYHPLNAFTRKCASLLRAAQERGTVNPRPCAMCLGILSILPHVLVLHFIHALAVVHGTGLWYMAGVQGVGLAALLVLVIVGGVVVLKDDEPDEEAPTSARS
jgi:hypothetical protein